MPVDQSILNEIKGRQEADAQVADIGGAVNKGQKLIEDQLEKNLQMRRDEEDREHELKRQEYQEFLWDRDVDDKLTADAVEKETYFNLIDQGIQSGQLSGPSYDGFIKDREMWWKDSANKYKSMADVGDKSAFKKKLQTAVQAEQNWGRMIDGAQSIAISDGAPDAQRKNLAITGWGKANGSTPPPISSKNGVDFFVIPNSDINGDGKIDQSDVDGNYDESQVTMVPVKDAASAQTGTELYGPDVREKQTVAGVQRGFTQTQMFNDFANGYGDEGQLGTWLDSTLLDDVAVKEVAHNIFQNTGIDPIDVGLTDINGDGKVDFEDLPKKNGQYDKAAVREILKDVMLNMEGIKGKEQDPSKKPLSLEDQKTKADIAYKKSQAYKNYQTGKGKGAPSEAEIKSLNNSYDKWIRTGDIGNLKNKGNVSDVRRITEAEWEEQNPSGKFDSDTAPWVIVTKNKQIIEAGSGDRPNEATIKGELGLDPNYQQRKYGVSGDLQDQPSFLSNLTVTEEEDAEIDALIQ